MRVLLGRTERRVLCARPSQIFREHALRRRHFDGDPIPFDVYTASEAEWAVFSSAACDPAVLELPPSRCDQGMLPERSVLTCGELRQNARVPALLEVRRNS